MRTKILNITKPEYIKILKNRGISIKRSASKQEILKLINNLSKKDFSYLLQLRNIKINDDGDLTKSIVNPLTKDAHTKKLITVQQQLHKKMLIKRLLVMFMN